MDVQLDFAKVDGLLPAIVQDHETGDVLMLAYMNEDAWKASLSTGRATYFSRSRQRLWVKGETSGNIQLIKEAWIDCDNDTVLLRVEQVGGAACHKGYRSCFFRKIEGNTSKKGDKRFVIQMKERGIASVTTYRKNPSRSKHKTYRGKWWINKEDQVCFEFNKFADGKKMCRDYAIEDGREWLVSSDSSKQKWKLLPR